MWAGETVQLVKCLQNKQEGLYLSPRIQVKEARHGADTRNPTAGEVEAGRSLALTRQFRLLVRSGQ